MYDLILTALYQLNNLNSDEERAQYLHSLKPTARNLRSSFNPSIAPNVSVNYRPKDIQAAYMLRYFPLYTQVIRSILNKLRIARIALPFNQENVSACFFGAGPAPEAYGFIQFLNSNFKNVQKVTAYSFDIISDEWAYWRNATENYLIPGIWKNRKFEMLGSKFDLSQTDSVNELIKEIAASRLIVFQNCLNEISQGSYPNVVANFTSLIRAMSSGSILLVIDLSSYPPVTGLISQIESLVDGNSASILISLSEGQSRYDGLAVRDALPLIVKQHLLTDEDGLIARRYVNYHCLAIRKI